MNKILITQIVFLERMSVCGAQNEFKVKMSEAALNYKTKYTK